MIKPIAAELLAETAAYAVRLGRSRRKRLASELSQVFSKLVAGKLSASEIPDVHFDHPVSEWMKGFVPLMKGRRSLAA